MEFGERFRALRLKKGLSEDQLAAYFGVSWKDITAWEKGREEPSLPMLMKIAAYFGVSTDSLLGMDRILRDTLIADYLERYQDHIAAGRLPEAIAVMREGLTHFPDNPRLKCMLLYALYLSCTRPAAIKHYSPEILSLGDDLLATCTDDTIRYEARRVLCLHLFEDLKDYSRALEVARGLPPRKVCREEMIAEVSSGQERATALRANLLEGGEALVRDILRLLGEEGAIPPEERLPAIRLGAKLLETLFPGDCAANSSSDNAGEGHSGDADADHDQGGASSDSSASNHNSASSASVNAAPVEVSLFSFNAMKDLALTALREGYFDDGFALLERAACLAVAYDALPEKSTYRTPLLRGLPLPHEPASTEEPSASRAMLASIEVLGGSDALRYDPRLARVLSILTGHDLTASPSPEKA